MSFADEIAIRTIYGEARGEPVAGKIAVGWVIYNRVKSGRWGATAALVCLAHLQFSSWNDGDPNRHAMLAVADDDALLAECRDAWSAVGEGFDPSGGALYYFADTIAPPSWSESMTQTVQIGAHRFFKEKMVGEAGV